jgi:hypothetical protein
VNATGDLSLLAEQIERARADVLSPAAIARATGHPVSTISRDRAEKPIIDWKARDLLLLARACPEIAAALRAYLDQQPQELGQAEAVPADLSRDVRATGRVDQTIRDALADGVLRAREIDDIRTALATRRTSDAQLDRDLRAARRTAKP